MKNSKELKNILNSNRKYIFILFLVFGFVFDSLTLTRVDRLYDNLVVTSHLVVVVIFLSILAIAKLNKKNKLPKIWLDLTNFFIPFSLGGLFSAFAVFYLRSGTILVYFPFIVILLFVMIASELYKNWLEKVPVILALLFFAIQSYFAFLFPIIFKSIQPGIILFSGVAVLFFGFLYLVFWYKVLRIRFNYIKYGLWIVLVTLVFQIFYLLNLVPPAPLATKVAMPAYNVERILEDNSYHLTFPDLKWDEKIKANIWGPVLYFETGQRIYFYGSVFAPNYLETTIEHRWYFKEGKRWVEKSRIPIRITGGREGGFRGFSFKQSLGEGDWRVDITTESGKVIGRSYFSLILDKELSESTEKIILKD